MPARSEKLVHEAGNARVPRAAASGGPGSQARAGHRVEALIPTSSSMGVGAGVGPPLKPVWIGSRPLNASSQAPSASQDVRPLRPTLPLAKVLGTLLRLGALMFRPLSRPRVDPLRFLGIGRGAAGQR